MNSIKPEEVNIIFIDKESVYKERVNDLTIPRYVFKSHRCIENLEHFNRLYLQKNFQGNEHLLVFVHAFRNKDNEKWKARLEGTIQTIKNIFSELSIYIITSTDMHIVSEKFPNEIILNYPQIKDRIINKSINIQTVDEILGNNEVKSQTLDIPKTDYSKNGEGIDIEFENLNDWRLHDLDSLFSIGILKIILGTCFSSRAIKKFILSVVDPGLSGAFLFKIKYFDNYQKYEYVLKLKKFSKHDSLFNKDSDVSFVINNIIEASADHFITYISKFSVTDIEGYDCCVYKFFPNPTTLANYLSHNMDKLSLANAANTITQIFRWYEIDNYDEKNKWHINEIFSRPWTGTDSYEGLKIKKQYKNDIKGKILKVLGSYSESYLKVILNFDHIFNYISEIFEFLDSGRWKTAGIIDNSLTNVPVSFVHGDFNSGNILVNASTGLNPQFIDLSQLMSGQHALLDIGKLSVEMEKRILPDYMLLENRIKIQDLIYFHRNWLTNDSFVISEDETLLEKIYSLVNHIKLHAIKRLTGDNLSLTKEEIIRQFHMVRLQYFFRMVGQDHIIPQKKLFAITAAVDILEFITRTR